MKFGEAITLLNAGHPVTRQGWNGKGMFLIKAGGYSVPAEDARPNGIITKEFLKGRGLTHLEILPHIDMWTAQNTYLAGWLASQSDMLADDWMMYVEMPDIDVDQFFEKRGNGIVTLKKKPHWTQTPEGKKIMAKRKARGSKK
jgi:hypothetical protein